MSHDVLSRFSSPTRAWFECTFAAPTAAQAGTWDAVAAGDNALVIAPTGSGKTLAGFLWSLDDLSVRPAPERARRLRVLYVSPLKALAVDIERNLRSPLKGIQAAAGRLGVAVPDIRVGVRTGDTPSEERRRLASAPPDILITTPESLFLLLTSQARETLRSVETVIVDEVHALAATKRGAHLALSLERLDRLAGRFAQRLGLSATVRPAEEIATWLGGSRPVTVVHPASDKRFDLSVVVPVEDMTDFGEPTGEIAPGTAAGVEALTSVWPHVEERLLALIRDHDSTIVFVNSRRLAERLCARLNELAGEEVARSHHGSVARDQRVQIEEQLKAGRLPAVVATSSLELGIDMAAVDLVVQVEAPDSVASGLQRIGRAGHQVGSVSRGMIFPKYRGDLLECAVVVQRMQDGAIEAIRYPRNPLDVLAQQIVSMVAMEDWEVDDVADLTRRAAAFRDLPQGALEATLDMLSGRYPSNEFAELRPRINWDRATNVLSARRGAQHLAVTSGGTIPDRGLFGVWLAGAEARGRVGELDEEMVYESRPGDVFVLGASSWRIEDITHDRVMVSPAPGQPGKMPFWHGDALGRPVELGKALGRFVRELSGLPAEQRSARLAEARLDDHASSNLIAYLDEQRDATGTLPDDRTIVIERFRDEMGDWRVCIHSFFGARVHAPWAQAIETRIRERLGLEAQCIYTDDGLVLRLPEADEAPPGDSLLFEPEEVEDLVVESVGTSALFSSRFRECAARALLLPRRRPGSRTPLWLQRQKSAQLLRAATRFESFPIVLETFRECLQDVFDLPALIELMSAVRRREVRVVEVDTPVPSPFASSLQFGYVSAFMYEGDVPLAERRAQALSLDRSLLAEIMGRAELRELIDQAALADLEIELQHLAEPLKARDADLVHDLLRHLGDLTLEEVAARCAEPASATAWLEELLRSHRALLVRISGEPRWIAAEDAARWRDALGVALPTGLPSAFLEATADPLVDVVARFARTHGPFEADDVARRFSLGRAVVEGALRSLQSRGRVLEGEFRPQGIGREWIDAEVLRRLRRKSLAAWRKEIEPAPPEALARFTLAWHGLNPGSGRPATSESLLEVVEQLAGAPVPASALERQVLATRLPAYSPTLLDELGASGEIIWTGCGALGRDDGWVALALVDQAALVLPEPISTGLSPQATAIRDLLERSGALFFRQVADSLGATDDPELVLSLWELVWAGWATNDTFAPLRALVGGVRRSRRGPRRGRGPAFPSRTGPPAAAGRWSLVPARETSATMRLHALGRQMLARHGIVTRGALAVERAPGGFAGVYPVFKAMEEAGGCRRGYFVDGLGGAQFALPGAVDRMRALVDRPSGAGTLVLAATDPANPYGAALAWPEPVAASGHRAGRKAGAVCVLVEGRPVLYVERGGKTMLSYSDDDAMLQPAVDALVLAARDGVLGSLALERADGAAVLDTPVARVLMDAGFRLSSRGLRLRA